MNRRCCYPLPVLIVVVVLVGGCGTTKLPELVNLKGNKPWIFLAGAKVQQAKSLAMGAAVTKGWEIADAAGDKLLVRRPLSTTTAQAIAGEPVSRAAVEVRTDFDQRRAGVDVIVAATMVADKITAKGEKSAVRVDVTESYKAALNRSLSALRQSWEQNRWRIAAAMRPLPTKDTVSKDEDTKDTFGAMADRETDTPASSTPASYPPKKTATAPIAASSSEDRAVTTAAPSTRGRPAPIEDRALSRPRSMTPSTPDRARTAAVSSTHSRPTLVEDQAPATPHPSTPSALDRAMAAIAPGARGGVAPVEDRALARPRPVTPSTPDSTMTAAVPVGVSDTSDRAMTIPAPVGTLSPRGRVAPIEDRALSRPRPMTPSALDSTMTTAAPIGVSSISDRAMTIPAPVGVSSRAAPVEDRALSRPRPITPSPTPGTLSAAGPSDIPALDRARRAGAWAYYAEQYARTHGCERADGGTTLEYKQPKYELHRIRCENGDNFLLRCNAGACVRQIEN